MSTPRTIEAQEGQVSIAKDDTVVLVDDANAYWWLVRAVKSDIIGRLLLVVIWMKKGLSNRPQAMYQLTEPLR